MTTNPMNTNLDPDKIVRLLTISTRQLDAGTLSALRNARQNALEKQAVRSPVLAVSASRGTFHNLVPELFQHRLATGLLMMLLVLGTGYWHHVQQEEQIVELDVAILTDDLPIDVFVD